MTIARLRSVTIASFFALALLGSNANAEDTLKIAIGLRGNWDTAVCELGQKAGFFKKHGIVLETLYTQGAGETLQAVISGSVDIGFGIGTMGGMSAYAKGAPVRAIASAYTGASELFWYVRADSPIKSMADVGERTFGYSTNGSSSNTVALALVKRFASRAKPTATGSPTATLTQVMSGQIDVGWSSPPFGLDALAQNKIRIIARGSDVPELQDQTVRLLTTNTSVLQAKKDVLARFLAAYRESLDWMYSDDAALKSYSEWIGVPEEIARRTREFYPKTGMSPDRISGLTALMNDAVTFKYLAKPLTPEQVADFFQKPDQR
jgi:NitT/TauT family transport system substrate-binding protein